MAQIPFAIYCRNTRKEGIMIFEKTFNFSFLTFNFRWHRIISSRIPRMTAGYPFETQPSAFDDAVFINRLVCVLRARWMKPAQPFGINIR